MDLLSERLTELEKQRAKELLDELSGIGPEELLDWNIRANTFLVFTACRHPSIIFEAPRRLSGNSCG